MKKKIIAVIILTIIIFLIIRFGFNDNEISNSNIELKNSTSEEIQDINIPLRNDTVEINLQNIEAK